MSQDAAPKRLRIALLSHDASWTDNRAERHMIAAFRRHIDVEFVDVDKNPTAGLHIVPDRGSLDAAVTFYRYRQLMTADPIDWAEYTGPRIQMDTDASSDFTLDSRYTGTWPNAFRRHRFDHLVVSGLRAVEHFEAGGIPTSWLPKACDGERFRDLGRWRDGIGHFGSLYRSRQAMLRYLRRAGCPVEHVQVPYERLNDRLNDFNGVVAATLEAHVRWGKLGRAVERKLPGAALVLGSDIEPMLKTFEIGGAGAAPLLAPSPDLAELGFVDGSSAVIWQDFAELADVVRSCANEPESMHRIGRAAHSLVHQRHTWDHRALELAAIIRRVRGEVG
jgi:hypothetical protein